MVHKIEIPDSIIGQANMLEKLLISCATGGSRDNSLYEQLRLDLMKDTKIKSLVPDFVVHCRNLHMFWSFIKSKSPHYEQRRLTIRDAFTPLIKFLESVNGTPSDDIVSDALQNFDCANVHAVWSKALERRHTDPEGAITVARTLLETICKHMLDEMNVPYTDKEDLPKLYSMAAKSLNLAPDQHVEEPIKAILGGAMTLINGIGTLRNRFSDAHGTSRRPVKPAPRHANLAVNTAGAMATFLVETFIENNGSENSKIRQNNRKST